MRRPAGVTLIACLFLLSGIYLCSFAAIQLVAPNAIDTIRRFPFIYGLRLASPYTTFAIAICWSLVAWGLLRLRDWSRWVAQIMLSVGVAWALPMLYFGRIHFGWRMFVSIADIIFRVLAIGYLFAPSVMDAFLSKRSTEDSVPESSPGL